MSEGLYWQPVWLRHYRVWRAMMIPSLLGSFGEPFLYLLALGFGLGRFVQDFSGIPYRVFLATGIVCSGAMNTASFECLYSAYTRMSSQKTWDAILTSPIGIRGVVMGEMMWAATKSIISTIAILIVAYILGLIHGWQIPLVLPIVFLIGACFACLALMVTAIAHSYDFFLYYFTLFLTPIMLLSGVFFPLDSMPNEIQWVMQFLPLLHGIDLVRPILVGQFPPDFVTFSSQKK